MTALIVLAYLLGVGTGIAFMYGTSHARISDTTRRNVLVWSAEVAAKGANRCH